MQRLTKLLATLLVWLGSTALAAGQEPHAIEFGVTPRVFQGETPLITIRVKSDLPLIKRDRAQRLFSMEMKDERGASLPIRKPFPQERSDLKKPSSAQARDDDFEVVKSPDGVGYEFASHSVPQAVGPYSLRLKFQPLANGAAIEREIKIQCVELGKDAIVERASLKLPIAPGRPNEVEVEVLNAKDEGRHYMLCRFLEKGAPPRIYRTREVSADSRFAVIPKFFEVRENVQQLWVAYNREGKLFVARLDATTGLLLREEHLDRYSRPGDPVDSGQTQFDAGRNALVQCLNAAGAFPQKMTHDEADRLLAIGAQDLAQGLAALLKRQPPADPHYYQNGILLDGKDLVWHELGARVLSSEEAAIADLYRGALRKTLQGPGERAAADLVEALEKALLGLDPHGITSLVAVFAHLREQSQQAEVRYMQQENHAQLRKLLPQRAALTERMIRCREKLPFHALFVVGNDQVSLTAIYDSGPRSKDGPAIQASCELADQVFREILERERAKPGFIPSKDQVTFIEHQRAVIRQKIANPTRK